MQFKKTVQRFIFCNFRAFLHIILSYPSLKFWDRLGSVKMQPFGVHVLFTLKKIYTKPSKR